MVVTYDSYPKPNTGVNKPSQPPPEMIPNPAMQGSNMGGPNMGPGMGPGLGPVPGGMQQGPPLPQGFNLPPNLNLPPDLANILGQIQNTQTNNGDPVMAQVKQIISNLMVSWGKLQPVGDDE